MTVFSDRKVRQSLLKKGFQNEPSKKKHHNYFYFYVNGKRTCVNTHTSRDEHDIGDELIKCMSNQLFLSKKDFERLILCPLKYDEYVKILKDKRVIDI